MTIHVNGRFRQQMLTGVQRCATEIVARLGDVHEIIPSGRLARGLLGHGWEQTRLPLSCRGGVLWSPCNTGPLSVRRQVVTIHDMAFVDRPEGFGRRFRQWYSWLIPRLARRVARITTVSEYSKSRIVDVTGVPAEKVVVAPNGVDGRFRPLDEDEIVSVRERWSCQRPYVLTVGSLEPRKNLGALIRAWTRVNAEEDVELLIVGARAAGVFGELTLPEVPSNVRFLGRVDDEDLVALLCGASVFAYPSLYEGFGLPPLEAMACGTCVVASRTTSIPEVVGTAAVLVDPADPDSIADGLDQALTNSQLRKELERAGLRQAACFSWDHATRIVREVLVGVDAR